MSETRTRTKAEYRVEELHPADHVEQQFNAWCRASEEVFADTRAAEVWLRANAQDGTTYRIVRVCKQVTAKKVVEEKVKLT